MNRQMIDELKDVASQITASDNIRLVILRAEDRRSVLEEILIDERARKKT